MEREGNTRIRNSWYGALVATGGADGLPFLGRGVFSPVAGPTEAPWAPVCARDADEDEDDADYFYDDDDDDDDDDDLDDDLDDDFDDDDDDDLDDDDDDSL